MSFSVAFPSLFSSLFSLLFSVPLNLFPVYFSYDLIPFSYSSSSAFASRFFIPISISSQFASFLQHSYLRSFLASISLPILPFSFSVCSFNLLQSFIFTTCSISLSFFLSSPLLSLHRQPFPYNLPLTTSLLPLHFPSLSYLPYSFPTSPTLPCLPYPFLPPLFPCIPLPFLSSLPQSLSTFSFPLNLFCLPFTYNPALSTASHLLPIPLLLLYSSRCTYGRWMRWRGGWHSPLAHLVSCSREGTGGTRRDG